MRSSTIFLAAAPSLILIGAALPAQAQSTNEKAYTLALTCTGVASYYHDDPGIAKSMGALRRMSAVLGYSYERQSADMIEAANVLGVNQRNDATTMDQWRARCQRYGLVS